jgi:hypothetical protein
MAHAQRSGRASARGPLLLGLAALAAAGLWLLLVGPWSAPAAGTGGPDAVASGPVLPAAHPGPPAATPGPLGPAAGPDSRGAEGTAVTRRTAGERTAVPETPLPLLPADGRPIGVLRGQVQAPAGVPLPAQYTVELTPSRTSAAARFAAERTVQVDSSAGWFELRDLPLGGYDVLVRGEGLESPRVPVLLHPGREEVFLVLQLERTATVDGRVVDAQGSVVSDLEVVLTERGEPRSFSVRTDAAGRFRFTDVPEGAFQLALGSASAPVVPLRDLTLTRPGLSLGDLEVPRLESLWLRLVDEGGGPVSGARVHGYGSAGGHVDATSDPRGEVLVPLLPPGRYRLRAADDQGRQGFLALELVRGAGRSSAELVLRR